MTGDRLPVDVVLPAGLQARLEQDGAGQPRLVVRDGETITARVSGAGDDHETLDSLDALIDGLCQLRAAIDDRRRAEWASTLPEHLRRDSVRLPRIHPPIGNSGRH